jgi:hypothetical protein
MNTVQQVVDALVYNKAWRAVKYLSPTLVVRATRRLIRQKIDHNDPNIDVRLGVGKPNFREREFIIACKKAGEKFPVRRIQLQMPPTPRKKRA